MNDTGLAILAGALLVIGCLIGGLILVSGLLSTLPGANTLMAFALIAFVPATLGLIVFLVALGKS